MKFKFGLFLLVFVQLQVALAQVGCDEFIIKPLLTTSTQRNECRSQSATLNKDAVIIFSNFLENGNFSPNLDAEGSCVGIQLKKPVNRDHIRFCPRDGEQPARFLVNGACSVTGRGSVPITTVTEIECIGQRDSFDEPPTAVAQAKTLFLSPSGEDGAGSEEFYAPFPVVINPPNPGFRFLGTLTIYRRHNSTNDIKPIDFTLPEGTDLVEMRMLGQNLRNYGKLGPTDLNPLTEDIVAGFISIDLKGDKTSGNYSVIGGSQDNNTLLITWKDQKNFDSYPSETFGFTGDNYAAKTYGTHLANFKPAFSYSGPSRDFSLKTLPQYVPAQFAFVFEFYGR